MCFYSVELKTHGKLLSMYVYNTEPDWNFEGFEANDFCCTLVNADNPGNN